MKKIIRVTAFLVAVSLTLAACGSDTSSDVQQTEVTTTSTAAETTEATAEETTTTTPAPAGIISTGMTELYKSAFLTYADGVGTMTYSSAKEYAESLGMNVEFTEPTDEDMGTIQINDTTGDYVWVMTYPNSNNVEMISTVCYNHLELYEISTGDNAHTSAQYFHTFNKNRDPRSEDVSSLKDCELFMFGETSDADIQVESLDYTLRFGELLDTNVYNNQLIVKAKIESQLTNKQTINQNYFNVEDLIKNQGCDKYDAIQYWAVADMTDGSEEKVVSFTVPSSVIEAIKDETLAAAYMGDYVDDLYILPSLRD